MHAKQCISIKNTRNILLIWWRIIVLFFGFFFRFGVCSWHDDMIAMWELQIANFAGHCAPLKYSRFAWMDGVLSLRTTQYQIRGRPWGKRTSSTKRGKRTNFGLILRHRYVAMLLPWPLDATNHLHRNEMEQKRTGYQWICNAAAILCSSSAHHTKNQPFVIPALRQQKKMFFYFCTRLALLIIRSPYREHPPFTQTSGVGQNRKPPIYFSRCAVEIPGECFGLITLFWETWERAWEWLGLFFNFKHWISDHRWIVENLIFQLPGSLSVMTGVRLVYRWI